jgi:hypothetical protein
MFKFKLGFFAKGSVMLIQGYLPQADKDKVGWLNEFFTKFHEHAFLLDFNSVEIASIKNDFDMFAYLMETGDLLKQEMNKLISYKNLMTFGDINTGQAVDPVPVSFPPAPTIVPAGIFRRLLRTIMRIKSHPDYEQIIGEALGIIGHEPFTDRNTLQPELLGYYDAGRPVIQWKKEKADSIDIYVNRQDDKGFVFLINDTVPDYIDTYEIPEGCETVWEYKGIYKIENEQIGNYSNSIFMKVKKNKAILD